MVCKMFCSMLNGVNHPTACTFCSPKGSPNFNGFAGNYSRNSKASFLRVSVHHPGHMLSVGSHVWRRNVLVRTNDHINFTGVAASQGLCFLTGKLGRIDSNSAFCTAQRKADQRAFKGHQHRKPATSERLTSG